MALTMPTLSMNQIIGKSWQRTRRVSDAERRTHRLETYLATQHAITQIIARATELDSALPRILQAICETADWDFGEIWSIDCDQHRLCCTTTWCSPSLRFPDFEASGRQITFEPGSGLPGRVWGSGKAAWITNLVADRNFLRATIAERDGLRGGIGIPIRAEGEIIGAMTFFSRHLRQPDFELLQVLDTVGSQIGLFMERKRAEHVEREQARRVAMLEERQRLARDLHDSVTQTLFSASVIAEMLPTLWTRNPDQVQRHLNELNQLTRDALTEMRALLVEMRPPTLTCSDLNAQIRTLAESVASRTRLHIRCDTQFCGELSPDVQEALYRIAQETLNNITKHAAASEITIGLSGDENHFELQIVDNGRGFALTGIPQGHFGLQIMRERAEAIGAAFDIDSAPGYGTRLSVIHPCPLRELA